MSLVLAVAVIALLVWGLTTKSDLDTANDKVATLQAQVDQSAKSSDATAAAVKSAVGSIASQIGVTSADLGAAKQQIAQAKAQAQQGVVSASAGATLAAGCARAYLAAFGSLFDSGNLRTQVPAVVAQVQSLSADCKTALSGS